MRQNAVCVVGLHRDAVRDIKNQIGALLKVPIPLESFHVKSPSDIKVNIGKQIMKIKLALVDPKGIHRLSPSPYRQNVFKFHRFSEMLAKSRVGAPASMLAPLPWGNLPCQISL